MWYLDERTKCLTWSLYSTHATSLGGSVTARGSAGAAPRLLSRGGGCSLCAEAAPGSGRWGAASSPWTPDNSARGGEPPGPETLTSSLGLRCQLPGAQSWTRPSPSRSRGSAGLPQPNLTQRRGEGRQRPGRPAAQGGCARVPATREAPALDQWSRACHGGGNQPRARALELGLPGPLLRQPPCLHLLWPVDLRLLLLDRRPRTVMGTKTWWRRGLGGGGGRGGGSAAGGGGEWEATFHPHSTPPQSPWWKPGGKGAEREIVGGSIVPAPKLTVRCRLKSGYFPGGWAVGHRRRLGDAVGRALDWTPPVLGSSVTLSPRTRGVCIGQAIKPLGPIFLR